MKTSPKKPFMRKQTVVESLNKFLPRIKILAHWLVLISKTDKNLIFENKSFFLSIWYI